MNGPSAPIEGNTGDTYINGELDGEVAYRSYNNKDYLSYCTFLTLSENDYFQVKLLLS